MCASYSGSLLLSPVRPRLLDMASPEATEIQSHTDRDKEHALTALYEPNISTTQIDAADLYVQIVQRWLQFAYTLCM